MFSEERLHRIASVLFGILLIVAGVILFFKYLFGAILPFLLAYLIAFCLQPLIKKKTGLSRRVTVIAAVTVIVSLLALLCVLAFRRVSKELGELFTWVNDFLSRLRDDPDFADRMVDGICDKLPFSGMRPALKRFFSDVDGRLTSLLGVLAERLSGSVLPFLAGAAAFLPNALLSVAVVLLASYYFAVDFEAFNKGFLSLFPQSVSEKLSALQKNMGGVVGSFVRAYGLILFVTFSELFAAFLLLGYRYAFLLAVFISLVDVLPVLGTGTVLVPWAAFLLLTGSTADGIGLLIVYAVITVVRQVIEPKIVGKYIGLPPLAALASMYIGLKLLGFWGLFLSPLAALFVWKYVTKKRNGQAEQTEHS